MYGGKGFVMEIGHGITGIVMIPSKRVNEQGMGCPQITKGCA
jgi:hypothetical protein